MADYMEIGADGQPRLDFSRLTRDEAAAIHEVVVETRTEERDDGPPITLLLISSAAFVLLPGRRSRVSPVWLSAALLRPNAEGSLNDIFERPAGPACLS